MIKRITCALTAILSIHATLADVVVTESDNQRRYDITIERVDFHPQSTANGGFVSAELVGLQPSYSGIRYRVGEPQLPVIRLYVSGDVEVLPQGRTESLTAPSHPLLPNQPSLVKLPQAERAFHFNKAVYRKIEPLVRQAYELSEPVSIAGQQVRLLTIYPLAYAPGLNQYTLQSAFTVIEKNIPIAIDYTPQPPTFAFIVAERFANHPTLNAYASRKQELGYRVATITINDTNRNPEAIREAIKKLYKDTRRTLRYALIIGDAEDIPGWVTPRSNGAQSDHYYRAIDARNYETDINGPDIGLGRIAVKTDAQLDAVLTKYLRYQQQEQTPDWLKTIAYIATDDASHWGLAEGTHNYVIKNYTQALEYQSVFPDTQPGGDKLYAVTHQATRQDVVRVMNLGRSIINYSGHGMETGWVGPIVTQEDVRSLNHPSALPFVISNACLTGHYETDESFAETWQRHPQGAILFWGAISYTYWDEDDILEKRMFDLIFSGKHREFNTILQRALASHWAYYGGEGKSKYYWEVYTTFGDPSLELKTGM